MLVSVVRETSANEVAEGDGPEVKFGACKVSVRKELVIVTSASRDAALVFDDRVVPSSPGWSHLAFRVIGFLIIFHPSELMSLIVLPKQHATHDTRRFHHPLLQSLIPNGANPGLGGTPAAG